MLSSTGSDRKIYIFLFIAGLIVYCLFTWAPPLFDWDEINFAESSREMMVSGNYFQVQIDFRPFWEKPPLFFWMQVVSMKIFGVNEFAARFPNALAGAITLCVLFYFGKRFRNQRFAWIVTGFYAASFLPHMYFKSGIIDPVFNLLIFLGVIHIIESELAWRKKESPGKHPYLAGLFTGLATLTKGPVAILVTALVWIVFKLVNDRMRFSLSSTLKYLGVLIATMLLYFGSLILFTPNGWELIQKFIVYQAELLTNSVAGHEQPVFYHPLIFLIGCFPLSAFAIRGMFYKTEDNDIRVLKKFLLILFWVVMILFSLVQTKIIHYSSLLYLPAVFLAAFYFEDLIQKQKKLKADTWIILGLGALLLSLPVLFINYLTSDKTWMVSKMTNEFAKACANADVPRKGIEFLAGVLFLLMTIAGFMLLVRKKYVQWLLLSVVSMSVYMTLLLSLVAPRIADYTQTAAVDFWKSHAKEDAWMIPVFYKSYAQYFYGETKPESGQFPDDWTKADRLSKFPIDKKVYMAVHIDKITDPVFIDAFSRFKKIGEKNGFVFYLREPE